MTEVPAPSKVSARRRWIKRIALVLLAGGAVLFALFAAVLAQPWVLVYPANWLLADQPIRILIDDARLEAPYGWRDPSKWRWRITGFALLSDKQGTPTILAEALQVSMPDLRRSWETRSLVIPRGAARGLTVSIPQPEPPPPFEEVDAWPLRALVVDEMVLLEFAVVMRDASGMPIVLDEIDGQVLDFRHDFGRREMFGRGACQGAHVIVGPVEAWKVQAIPVAFDGRTMLATGFGSVGGQRTHVVFGVNGLFRPAAAIHAEFDMEGADVRALLVEVLGDEAPNAGGVLAGRAVFDSKPPEAKVDITFRLVDGEIMLGDDTKKLLLTVLKVAPFVELDGHLVRLGVLSGSLEIEDGVITLTNGRYEADRSSAQVDGRVDPTSLRGRVRFAPAPETAGLTWGLVLSGTAKQPKVQLADQSVLEAWGLDGPQTTAEIREDVREARQDRREMMREIRQARRDEDPDAVVPEGSAPPLTGPVERLP